MNNIYIQITEKLAEERTLVLATVTGKSGSAPQEPGSSALFGENGLLSGTVGGGIVEGRIREIAIDSIRTGKTGHFQFNLSNDISIPEAAICGGQISILVDAGVSESLAVFEQLKESIRNRIPGVLLTMLKIKSSESPLISRFWITENSDYPLPGEFMESIKPVVRNILIKGLRKEYTKLEFSNPGEDASTLFLIEPVFPQQQLIIAGAGHIGRSLAQIGNMLDFEVTVIDDRPEYANFDNIKGASHIIVRSIGEAMEEIRKDNDTYVVIVTRGHKDDASALKPCIGSDVAYTGMIGSRNKISAMRRDFLDKGWTTPSQWEKIHAPIGLDIKSQTVEEIAISIAAELVLVRNTKKTAVLI